MKKLICIVVVLVLTIIGSALAEGELVVFFSHAGENYNVGVIEEGNTAKLAKVIAEHISRNVLWSITKVP